MVRLLLFGTHPQQYNGYSKVVHQLCKHLADQHADLQLFVFGFQKSGEATPTRELPRSVHVHDPFRIEKETAGVARAATSLVGFGLDQIDDHVRLVSPDVCLVYNDPAVTREVVDRLRTVPDRRFKIVVYIDLVYPRINMSHIEYLDKSADLVVAFTPGWQQELAAAGLRAPTRSLPHGIDTSTVFPMDRAAARAHFGICEGDFVVLNLNRNQPRKRWDICMKALAELVSRRPQAPIRLLVATEVQSKVGWNLLELYHHELKKRGVDVIEGQKHLIVLDGAQRLSDRDINILYNCADVGINTCDGEGFGLCNFEHAAVGVPQIVPRLGGFTAYLDDTCCTFVEPRMAYYVDAWRDSVGGEALMCDYADFALAIERYFDDRSLAREHGARARRRILEAFQWGAIADELYDMVKSLAGAPVLRRPHEQPVVYERAPLLAVGPDHSTEAAHDRQVDASDRAAGKRAVLMKLRRRSDGKGNAVRRKKGAWLASELLMDLSCLRVS